MQMHGHLVNWLLPTILMRQERPKIDPRAIQTSSGISNCALFAKNNKATKRKDEEEEWLVQQQTSNNHISNNATLFILENSTWSGNRPPFYPHKKLGEKQRECTLYKMSMFGSFVRYIHEYHKGP